MVLFSVHNLETAPEESKETLGKVQKQSGFLPNLYGVMANSPVVVKTYNEMGKYFGQTSFSPLERNIIWLTVSRINNCHYCVAIHSMVAKMYKVPDNIIESIRNNTPINDPKLETLRKFTALMTDKRGWASEEEILNFLDAGYTKKQILELIAGIAQKTISNYINHIANTPLDEQVLSYKWENH
ncbi:MAG: carboxymuconolactone decarboxylase family protein [Chlorobi bacterium]|nr:carboxymuconolactone decarboxylase family protein [Chlorobiota bacterium]